MLETPSTPLWLELIKAFGGPVIAAIFVIVGLMWKDRIERKNSAQSWFEQTYIKDGLDMLMCHLSALKDCTFETKRSFSIGIRFRLYLSRFNGALARFSRQGSS